MLFVTSWVSVISRKKRGFKMRVDDVAGNICLALLEGRDGREEGQGA